MEVVKSNCTCILHHLPMLCMRIWPFGQNLQGLAFRNAVKLTAVLRVRGDDGGNLWVIYLFISVFYQIAYNNLWVLISLISSGWTCEQRNNCHLFGPNLPGGRNSILTGKSLGDVVVQCHGVTFLLHWTLKMSVFELEILVQFLSDNIFLIILVTEYHSPNYNLNFSVKIVVLEELQSLSLIVFDQL